MFAQSSCPLESFRQTFESLKDALDQEWELLCEKKYRHLPQVWREKDEALQNYQKASEHMRNTTLPKQSAEHLACMHRELLTCAQRNQDKLLSLKEISDRMISLLTTPHKDQETSLYTSQGRRVARQGGMSS